MSDLPDPKTTRYLGSLPPGAWSLVETAEGDVIAACALYLPRRIKRDEDGRVRMEIMETKR